MPKAAELFAHLMHQFASWWGDTVTEDEYVRIVKSTMPAVQATKQRVKAADDALAGSVRPGSGKKKGKGGKKGKKAGDEVAGLEAGV